MWCAVIWYPPPPGLPQVVVDVTNPWQSDYLKLAAEAPSDALCDVEGSKDINNTKDQFTPNASWGSSNKGKHYIWAPG